MPTATITFNGYSFSANGRPHYTRQARHEGDAAGGVAHRILVTYSIIQQFLDDSFAANQARYQAMLAALKIGEATLLVTDETGAALVNTLAKPVDNNLPDQWGQYLTEVTVSFSAVEAMTAGPDATLGGVALKNVTGWRESIRVDHFTYQKNNRRESVGTVTANGKIVATPTSDEATRRTQLQTEKAAIRAVVDQKEATLAFAGFSKTVRIDSLEADIKDGSYEMEWSLAASYRHFPDGTYAEAEYDVDAKDDNEKSERITTVKGKVRGSTAAEARAKIATLTTTYLGSKTLRHVETDENLVDGIDGATSFAEITFTLEYRESIALLSWNVTQSDRADTKTGQTIRTYSGRVTAGDAATALAKARLLGASPEENILLASTETVATSQIGSYPVQFAEVTFSYEYLYKGAWSYAEVTSETDNQKFGESHTVVSGFCVAATEAAARILAEFYRPVSGLELNSKVSARGLTKDGDSEFVQVDFSYTYHLAAVAGSIEYSVLVSKDYSSRQTTTTYSGTAYGPDAAAAGAMIDAILSGLTQKTRDDRTTNYKKDTAILVFESISFSVSFVGTLAAGSDDILEADFTLASTFSIDHAVLTPVPYGVAHVQTAMGTTIGLQVASGSIRALNLTTARTWGRGKKAALAGSGYDDPPEEKEETVYTPFSGTTVTSYRFSFTYARRYPNLV